MKPWQLATLRQAANNAARNLLIAIEVNQDVGTAAQQGRYLAQLVRRLREHGIQPRKTLSGKIGIMY